MKVFRHINSDYRCYEVWHSQEVVALANMRQDTDKEEHYSMHA